MQDYYQESPLSFRQQVVLALLHDLKWMPTFPDGKAAAEYIDEPIEDNFASQVKFSHKLFATLVNELADEIVRRSTV